MNIFAKLNDGARLPTYARPGDAGADLSSIEYVTITAGERKLVRTGVAVSIPEGCAGLMLPRSGNAAKHGVTLANAPGLIDSGYRGELVCIVQNNGHNVFTIRPGDRIAQLVIIPFVAGLFVSTDSLSESERGELGFGSSGR